LKSASINNPAIHLLVVDQINRYYEAGNLSPQECYMFAKMNTTAAKFAIAESSFGKGQFITAISSNRSLFWLNSSKFILSSIQLDHTLTQD